MPRCPLAPQNLATGYRGGEPKHTQVDTERGVPWSSSGRVAQGARPLVVSACGKTSTWLAVRRTVHQRAGQHWTVHQRTGHQRGGQHRAVHQRGGHHRTIHHWAVHHRTVQRAVNHWTGHHRTIHQRGCHHRARHQLAVHHQTIQQRAVHHRTVLSVCSWMDEGDPKAVRLFLDG